MTLTSTFKVGKEFGKDDSRKGFCEKGFDFDFWLFGKHPFQSISTSSNIWKCVGGILFVVFDAIELS